MMMIERMRDTPIHNFGELETFESLTITSVPLLSGVMQDDNQNPILRQTSIGVCQENEPMKKKNR